MADVTEGLLGQELSSPRLVKTPIVGTSQQLPALLGPLGAMPMGLIVKQSKGKAKGRLTLAGQCLVLGWTSQWVAALVLSLFSTPKDSPRKQAIDHQREPQPHNFSANTEVRKRGGSDFFCF